MGKKNRNMRCRAARDMDQCLKMDFCSWDCKGVIRCNENKSLTASVAKTDTPNNSTVTLTPEVGYCAPPETLWDNIKEGTVGGAIGLLVEVLAFLVFCTSKRMKSKYRKTVKEVKDFFDLILGPEEPEDPSNAP